MEINYDLICLGAREDKNLGFHADPGDEDTWMYLRVSYLLVK